MLGFGDGGGGGDDDASAITQKKDNTETTCNDTDHLEWYTSHSDHSRCGDGDGVGSALDKDDKYPVDE